MKQVGISSVGNNPIPITFYWKKLVQESQGGCRPESALRMKYDRSLFQISVRVLKVGNSFLENLLSLSY